MKNIPLFALLLLISQFSWAQNNTDKTINLTDLEGKWYINKSNFPMWLKGNKTAPTFNYTILTTKKDTVLKDKVCFIKNGKVKIINGIDKVTNSTNTEFVWRGNGLMKILKSKWQILHLDSKHDWAIIYFEKTLFTPAGYDIISRNKILGEKLEKLVAEKLSE